MQHYGMAKKHEYKMIQCKKKRNIVAAIFFNIEHVRFNSKLKHFRKAVS